MTMRTSSLLSLCALVLAALLLPLASRAAPAANAPLVPGEDYELIANGKPFAPVNGKIEVAEVFAYWCPHCHDFQPKLEAWLRKQPSTVRITYVPLPGSEQDVFARGYFAALDAGAIPRTHDALFAAVHDQQSVPSNPSVDELAAFYGTQGLNAARMKAAMSSPRVLARVAAATQFALHSQVEGTPTLVIDGKYKVKGNNMDAILDNAGRLIAQLRNRKP